MSIKKICPMIDVSQTSIIRTSPKTYLGAYTMITQKELALKLLDIIDTFNDAQHTRVFLDMALEYSGTSNSEDIYRCDALLRVFEERFTSKMTEVDKLINKLHSELRNPQPPELKLVG
jgi:membrane-anchored protein YejM (alkaline phosphatase superfamily)